MPRTWLLCVLCTFAIFSQHTWSARHGPGYGSKPQPARVAAPNATDLVQRPPMGWNSWYHFRCNVTEEILQQAADKLVDLGLSRIGYKYVVVDDCWSAMSRDEKGRLRSDPGRFPSGIKALAAYVHAKGLKFGIYADAGSATCQGRPGSLGFESVDAATFAAWDVDYLKYDNCNSGKIDARTRYTAMSDALQKSGRPIVFSMCDWGLSSPALWARSIAQLWRTTFDIVDDWTSMLAVMEINNIWATYAGPGGWNDPDVLQVGNGGMSSSEYRVHFTLWCIMKAPLLIGSNLANLSDTDFQLLSNAETLAINQDALGIQAQRTSRNGTNEVWSGHLSGNRHVVALLNRGENATIVSVDWSTLGLKEPPKSAQNIWEDTSVNIGAGNGLQSSVAAHDVALFVLQMP